MKTGYQICEFLDRYGINLQSLAREGFRFSDLSDVVKDAVIRWSVNALDDDALCKTLPGFRDHKSVAESYRSEPLDYVNQIYSFISDGDSSDRVLMTDAVIAANLSKSELTNLLITNPWEFYGCIASAINSYVQTSIEQNFNESISHYVAELGQELAS